MGTVVSVRAMPESASAFWEILPRWHLQDLQNPTPLHGSSVGLRRNSGCESRLGLAGSSWRRPARLLQFHPKGAPLCAGTPARWDGPSRGTGAQRGPSAREEATILRLRRRRQFARGGSWKGTKATTAAPGSPTLRPRRPRRPVLPPVAWARPEPNRRVGASGALELSKGSGKYHFPKGCPFCVLLREDQFKEFAARVAERPEITHVFLVTDSVEAFYEMAAHFGNGKRCVQLYRSYLDNFRINMEPRYAD